MTYRLVATLALLAGCARRPIDNPAVRAVPAVQVTSTEDYREAGHLKRHKSMAALERMLGLPRIEAHSQAL